MAKNKRPHNSRCKYLLESSGVAYGAYADLDTALKIARTLKGNWYIRNLSDEIVEAS